MIEEYLKKSREFYEIVKYDKNRYRSLKLLLLKEYGVCFWCQVPVRDVPRVLGMKDPPDMATIDHLVSRFHRKKGEVVDKVLCCTRCNSKRAHKENIEKQKAAVSRS